jgi:hypothetical protein
MLPGDASEMEELQNLELCVRHCLDEFTLPHHKLTHSAEGTQHRGTGQPTVT